MSTSLTTVIHLLVADFGAYLDPSPGLTAGQTCLAESLRCFLYSSINGTCCVLLFHPSA